MSDNSDIQTCTGPVGTLPVFEANQILTSKHLNDLRSYLDSQNRLTRTDLIGIGIVCGMEVSYICENDDPAKPLAIKISKGLGVTSEGYLIETDLTLLTYYQSYTDRAEYGPFWIKSGTVKSQIPLIELLTDPCENTGSSTTFTGISIKSNPAILYNKVLLIYLEIYDETQNSCFTDSCDGKGQRRLFTLKRLLVDKSQIENYIRSEYNISAGISLDDFFFKKYALPELAIKAIQLSNISGVDTLNNRYIEAIKNAIPSITSAFNTVYETYKGWCSNTSNPFQGLETKLNNIISDNKDGIQYVYDFIYDLIEAYREFKNLAFGLNAKCLPSHKLFPLHLMLGETNIPAAGKRTPFRNLFVQSPIHNHQAELIKKCQVLFKRLESMTKNFLLPKGSDNPVKITPGLLRNTKLSQTTIPFYYDILKIYEYWNCLLAITEESKYQLSYNANLYPEKIDFIENPLAYNHTSYNFLRIEGLLGWKLQTALEEITGIKNTWNLPFSHIAVCINEIFTDKDFNNDFNDSFKTDPNENYSSLKFSEFVKAHPGMEHIAGVEKGGTFILVYEEIVNKNGEKEATVVADFSLPYFYAEPEKKYGDFSNDFNDSYNIENN